MGLDMYLEAHKYLTNAEFYSAEKTQPAKDVLSAAGLADVPSYGAVSYAQVVIPVAYWRKANAIHAWFVKNVQENTDDCKAYYVSRERISELITECESVLDHASWTEDADGYIETVTAFDQQLAESALPTQSGFFFGNTDYSAYYLNDLLDTKRMLEKVLADPRLNECDLYYRSSW